MSSDEYYSEYDYSEYDYSYDYFIPINRSNNAGIIPDPVNPIEDSKFQLVKCYGYNVEFPLNKTPFPSQLGVMSTVFYVFTLWIYRLLKPYQQEKMLYWNLQQVLGKR